MSGEKLQKLVTIGSGNPAKDVDTKKEEISDNLKKPIFYNSETMKIATKKNVQRYEYLENSQTFRVLPNFSCYQDKSSNY